MQTWWRSRGDDVQIEADAREGGGYRIQDPEAGVDLYGSYLTVEPPHHLSFTCQWRDADGEGADEAVDIRFEQVPQGTLLRIRHSGPWEDSQTAERRSEGWQSALQQLADAVSI